MRYIPFLFVILSLAASNVHARAFDAKDLARYDLSYVKCEAQFPDMRGHRDEAYLSLWRLKVDKKAAARLDASRKSDAYQAERKKAQQSTPENAATASKLKQQCQGLWDEAQRNKKAKK